MTDKEPAKRQQLVVLSVWTLGLVVAALAYIAWSKGFGWGLQPFNAYRIFPLFGLLAYSLMWSHYVAGTVQDLLHIDKARLASYFRITGRAVLVLICLHPGLLIYQRFRDGHGLPPGSYESYVAHGLGWVTLFGTASLLVFLAFEFRRLYDKRSWWHFVPEAGDFAMLAIFYHSLRLGSQLTHGGWFRVVWWFYGVVLILILARSYAKKLFKTKSPA